MSIRTGKPMAGEFAARIAVTLSLLAGGGVLALVLSLAMGIAGAASNGGIVDRALRGLAGVGAVFIEAIRFRDFIGMQAALTLFVVFFVSVNLFADLLAMLADPRLRRP